MKLKNYRITRRARSAKVFLRASRETEETIVLHRTRQRKNRQRIRRNVLYVPVFWIEKYWNHWRSLLTQVNIMGREIPNEYVQLINDQLNNFHANEAFKFKLLALTLIGSARLWFNPFLNRSIDSWTDLCRNITAHFKTRKRQPIQ